MRPSLFLRPLPGLLAACLLAACQGAPVASATASDAAPAAPAADDLVAHGEYIVRIAGCNDCHTAGYTERGGQVPVADWLTGSPLGYRGPWGTTYATNLRLSVSALDEAQWLTYTANLHTRPIMPDFMLRQMREHDRRAIHRFVRSLGPAGTAAPEALPPGQSPPAPYFELVLPAPGAASATQNGQTPVQ
ncbi:cytochrome C [Luteimonas kalidii]|uniref:Cytochrome C n=1 Tax=Luteimonas kalidii TaxID=3042025 RepID=A0ABT6JY89_9GAMM|nr:cytochrome C [Luteimonas kalidii]MDH5835468.1 cytochrome C [Luteimonas kalidii]